MSVRRRLTLTYAGVLVVCGALLLAVSYGLVARSIDGAAPAAARRRRRLGRTDEGQLQILRAGDRPGP